VQSGVETKNEKRNEKYKNACRSVQMAPNELICLCGSELLRLFPVSF